MERKIGSSYTKNAARALLLATASMLVASCSEYTDYDPGADLQKEDYEQLLNRRAPEQGAQMEEPPIPDFQPVLAAPSAPELADVRRVSIAVTDATPLRDILIELARKAGV
ncbi:MAG: hypothetical protein HOO09_00190 [Rhodospirillaceae bacterium]|nr:hypothetical protein [Rhodospirillaceae bacterium]